MPNTNELTAQVAKLLQEKAAEWDSYAKKKQAHLLNALKNATADQIKVGIGPATVVEGYVTGNYTAEGGVKNVNNEVIRSATVNCDFTSVTSLYEVEPSGFGEFTLARYAKILLGYEKETVIKYNEREKVAGYCGNAKATDEFDKYNYKLFNGRLRNWEFHECGERTELPIYEVIFTYYNEKNKLKSVKLGVVYYQNGTLVDDFSPKSIFETAGQKFASGLAVALPIIVAILVIVGLILLPKLLN